MRWGKMAPPYKKKTIPKSLKENVWVKWVGESYSAKCYIEWCKNKITPFTFEAGHDIPESKGGKTCIENLRPICASCNKSMGDRYTIAEYSKLYKKDVSGRCRWLCCVRGLDSST